MLLNIIKAKCVNLTKNFVTFAITLLIIIFAVGFRNISASVPKEFFTRDVLIYGNDKKEIDLCKMIRFAVIK